MIPFHGLAQDVDVQVEASAVLTNAQIIELGRLALDSQGRGSRNVTLFLRNNSENVAENLFLDITFSNQRDGVIMTITQRNDLPFSLNPGQNVVATNNDLSRGRLPGVNMELRFTGDLTSAGRRLLNRLEGRRTLPAGEYFVDVGIYQGNNRLNGGVLIARGEATLGSMLVEDDLNLFAQFPGDAVGSGVVLNNPYPEFKWEGPEDLTYRVIVVEAIQRESAESLIEGAKSTSPSEPGGTPSLLEFENMDVLVRGTSFQYPATGVQPLSARKRYYWQVTSTLQTTSGSEEIVSEIWEFTIGNDTADGESVPMDEELRNVLEILLGRDAFTELNERGFDLESIALDENEIFGEVARDELIRLIELVREGKIRVIIQ